MSRYDLAKQQGQSRLTYVEQQVISLICELSTQETETDADIRTQVERHGLVERMRHILNEPEEDVVYHSPLLRLGTVMDEKREEKRRRREAAPPMVVIPLDVNEKGTKVLKHTPVNLPSNRRATSSSHSSSTPISDRFSTTGSRSNDKDEQRTAAGLETDDDPFSPSQYAPRLLPQISATKATVHGVVRDKFKPLPALPSAGATQDEEDEGDDESPPPNPSTILTDFLGANRSAHIPDRTRRVLSVIAQVIDRPTPSSSRRNRQDKVPDTTPFHKTVNAVKLSKPNTYSPSSSRNANPYYNQLSSPSSSSIASVRYKRGKDHVLRPETNTTLQAAQDTRQALGRSSSLAASSRRDSPSAPRSTSTSTHSRTGSLGSGARTPRPPPLDAALHQQKQLHRVNGSFGPTQTSPGGRKYHYKNGSMDGFQGSTCVGETWF